MQQMESIKKTYNDVTIVPCTMSSITSRSQCEPTYDGKLPIFTAPMSTIINEKNEELFRSVGINTIMPRNIGVDVNDTQSRKSKLCDMLIKQHKDKFGYWIAVSWKEFKDIFVKDDWHIQDWLVDGTYRICIDLANGHMFALYEDINMAKDIAKAKGYTLVIMTGNIANPETYRWIAQNSNVDYIRIGIGSGNNCITSSNTGVHYPMASLIEECRLIYKSLLDTGDFTNLPYIVADGGIRNYADVIKALGLGANYVMIGSIFTGLLESAADITGAARIGGIVFNCSPDKLSLDNGIEINCWNINASEEDKRKAINWYRLEKESYGMSTKKAQELFGGNANKTSEGCYKKLEVKYTINQWVDNMKSYLRSAMSYVGIRTIADFIGNVHFVCNSPNAINVVNK